ncbi:hypothetical protein QE405_003909 [Nocardioides zeae]|uniref:Uncharacterized protein n=1 Tax=Nocardioides zeae TaxID=1457234 RepID=A0AAJ1U2Y5_9ACTN|nr:hypothetical protein [Nocardioides zeae]
MQNETTPEILRNRTALGVFMALLGGGVVLQLGVALLQVLDGSVSDAIPYLVFAIVPAGCFIFFLRYWLRASREGR